MKAEVHNPPPYALTEASTATLVREALDEAKELVRLEVAMAREEVEGELERVKKAAIGFGVAVGCTLVVLSTLALALVLALGGTAVVALCVAGGFMVVAGIAAGIGYALMPKKPLENTRRRLEADFIHLKDLKERVA